MSCRITVILTDGDRLEFTVPARETASCDSHEAHEWLAREFEAAGCVPANPVGKLLLADKVLSLAKTVSATTFRQPTPWLRDYFKAVACAIGRPVVTVDLAAGILGY
ncbi:MAG TPA: hypothetical protein VMB75_11330 [Rhodocyclaceae bacterium]|nr:hypothetical protein [Rhodocyclaceae bacterium]